jgi:hypothetical protein
VSDAPDDAEVIALRPGIEKLELDAPLRTKDPRHDPGKRYCMSHERRVELDVRARRVYCRDCGEEVPAFDYIERLARDFERYLSRMKEARRETEYREKKVEDLKREEANARARIRRLIEKERRLSR